MLQCKKSMTACRNLHVRPGAPARFPCLSGSDLHQAISAGCSTYREPACERVDRQAKLMPGSRASNPPGHDHSEIDGIARPAFRWRPPVLGDRPSQKLRGCSIAQRRHVLPAKQTIDHTIDEIDLGQKALLPEIDDAVAPGPKAPRHLTALALAAGVEMLELPLDAKRQPRAVHREHGCGLREHVGEIAHEQRIRRRTIPFPNAQLPPYREADFAVIGRLHIETRSSVRPRRQRADPIGAKRRAVRTRRAKADGRARGPTFEGLECLRAGRRSRCGPQGAIATPLPTNRHKTVPKPHLSAEIRKAEPPSGTASRLKSLSRR